MHADQAPSLLAGIVFLAIACLSLTRRRDGSALSLALALTCACLFAYVALDVASDVSTQPMVWDWLADVASCCATLPTLELLLGYIGIARRLRWFRVVAHTYFCGLLAISAARFVLGRDFLGDRAWAAAMLVGLAPSLGVALAGMLRHVWKSSGEERRRTQLLVGALVIGGGGVALDLVAMTSVPSPRFANLGLAAAALLVAALVLRARIVEHVSAPAIVGSAIAALACMVGLIWLASADAPWWSFAVVASFTTGVSGAVLVRHFWSGATERRARLLYLAELGRLAEQLAHDLRNPLCAIHGAAQFLQEEHRRGRPLERSAHFIDLIADRSEWLGRVVSDYRRLGRGEPALAPVDLNEIVGAALLDRREGGRLAPCMDLAGTLPVVLGDRDLLLRAIGNIVQNAEEAMPDGGALHASTRVVQRASGRRIQLRLADDGPGMDVRTQERAFDPLFTTKDSGSGLGLAFVARVVRAHGGRVAMRSQLGRGTLVEIELPAA